MKHYSHDLIIIGGGAAGLSCASGCCQLGLKTALIEKEKLGGDCLYYGCVPSKTLIRTANIKRLIESSSSFGLSKIDHPKVNLVEVMDRVHKVIQNLEHHDSPERFQRMGTDLYNGKASFSSKNEIRIDKTVLSAPKIVIATGSSPREIPIPGIYEAGFMTNREIFSLEKIPSHLAVIGTGPIGVELGQAFLHLGSNVSFLTEAEHILSREDPDMAAVVERDLIEQGASIYYSSKIQEVKNHYNKKRIFFSQGNTKHHLDSDEILLAAGRYGNSKALHLHNAGIEEENSFIPTKTNLLSSNRSVFAIGDVNGRQLFTHVAGAEAGVALQRIAFHIPARMNYTVVPWCTYTYPELASVGFNEKRAHKAGIEYRISEYPVGEIDRAIAEGDPEGKMKVLLDHRNRIIGVQIVAAAAGELLAPALFAVKNRYALRDVVSTIFPYPTMTELYKKNAGSYYQSRLFNPRVRSLLRFLFRYRGSGPTEI